MDPNWTRNDPPEVKRAQAVWDALASGDPGPAIEGQAENIVFDNGPGAGPWRHTEGQPAFLEMIGSFFPLFGESFKQTGVCVFANEQFSVTLVSETGTHGTSGDMFDNRAIYVSRLDSDGKTDHVWTVDLDSEDMESFWQANPVDGT